MAQPQQDEEIEWCFQPSSFVSHSHFNCIRKLELDAKAAALQSKHKSKEGSPRCTSLGEQHTARGYKFEDSVVEILSKKGLVIDFATAAAAAAAAASVAQDPNQQLREVVFSVPAGVVRFVSQAVLVVPENVQATLRANCGGAASRLRFSRTRPDLLKVDASPDGLSRKVTVIDIKSSAKAKPGHRMQIAFYAICLEVIFSGTSVSIECDGEVWLPKATNAAAAASSDEAAGGVRDATATVDDLHAAEPFRINKKPIADYFAQTIPQAMKGDPDWDFQPSCRGCPHLAFCKQAFIARERDLPEKEGDLQQRAFRGRGGVAVPRPKVPLHFVNGPRDSASAPLMVLAVIESCEASPTAASFERAFAAFRPATPAQMKTCCEASAAASLDAADGLVTCCINSVVELLDMLHQHVVGRGGEVAVWDNGQKIALLNAIKTIFCSAASSPSSAKAGEVLQLLWEDFDTLREAESSSDQFLHYLSRRCYVTQDVLEGLYFLPNPGPVTFEETRMLSGLARPAKYFAGSPPEALAAFRDSEFKQLRILGCFQDTFAEQHAVAPAVPLALVADLWNLLLLAQGAPAISDRVRPYPLPAANAASSRSAESSVPRPFCSSLSVRDISSHKPALLQFVKRQTLYTACRNASATWEEGNDPIQLVYDPLPTSPTATPTLEKDIRLFLCRFRVVASESVARISPCGLPVLDSLPHQESLEAQLETLSLASRADPHVRCGNKECKKLKQPSMTPFLVDAAAAAQMGPLGKTCAPGTWCFACTRCGNRAAADQLLTEAEVGLGSYFLTQSQFSPAKDETLCHKFFLVRDLCNVLTVQRDHSQPLLANDRQVASEGSWYAYITRGNISISGSALVPGETYWLHSRLNDFTTKLLREHVLQNDAVLLSPLLKMITNEEVDEGAPPPPTMYKEADVEARVAKGRCPLSVDQLSAIEHSLGPSHLTVLWGPPGTGKTSTLQTMLCTWMALHKDLRVLVVASTKAALAVIVEGQGGIQARGCPLFLIESFKALKAKEKSVCLTQRGLVVLSTVWQASKMISESPAPFDALVMDEASQMTVAQALLASRLVRPDCKVVVAGDLLQLPPIQEDVTPFLSPGDTQRSRMLFASRHSIMQAVMVTSTGGRLLYAFGASDGTDWRNVVQLRMSFRSVPDIVRFVGASYPLPMAASRTAMANPSLLTVTVEEVDVVSEACCVARVVSDIFREPAFSNKQRVLVVCPHRLQRYNISARLSSSLPASAAQRVIAETTEKMQGSEADVVVVAFAGGVNYLSTFPFDFHRLNVAISRARDRVILVVSSDFPLEVDPREHFGQSTNAESAIKGLELLQRFVKASVPL
jgi:hypothetical protein